MLVINTHPALVMVERMAAVRKSLGYCPLTAPWWGRKENMKTGEQAIATSFFSFFLLASMGFFSILSKTTARESTFITHPHLPHCQDSVLLKCLSSVTTSFSSLSWQSWQPLLDWASTTCQTQCQTSCVDHLSSSGQHNVSIHDSIWQFRLRKNRQLTQWRT